MQHSTVLPVQESTKPSMTNLMIALFVQKGYYTDVTNTSVCKSCVIGKYNNFTKGDDETDCEVCPKGRYNEQIHQVLCKICERGKYADQTERTSELGCKRCIAGRYNTEIEQKNVSACTKCGVGKYMNSSFLARITEADCTDCPRGKYNNEEGLDGIIGGDGGPEVNCKVCGVGTYANERRRSVEAVHCKSCEAGKFQPTTNQMVESSCTSCPVGWSQVDPRKPSCNECPKGYYQNEESQDNCGYCPAGFIIPVNKSIYCQDCSPGKREDGTRLVCVKTVPKESTLYFDTKQSV